MAAAGRRQPAPLPAGFAESVLERVEVEAAERAAVPGPWLVVALSVLAALAVSLGAGSAGEPVPRMEVFGAGVLEWSAGAAAE